MSGESAELGEEPVGNVERNLEVVPKVWHQSRSSPSVVCKSIVESKLLVEQVVQRYVTF